MINNVFGLPTKHDTNGNNCSASASSSSFYHFEQSNTPKSSTRIKSKRSTRIQFEAPIANSRSCKRGQHTSETPVSRTQQDRDCCTFSYSKKIAITYFSASNTNTLSSRHRTLPMGCSNRTACRRSQRSEVLRRWRQWNLSEYLLFLITLVIVFGNSHGVFAQTLSTCTTQDDMIEWSYVLCVNTPVCKDVFYLAQQTQNTASYEFSLFKHLYTQFTAKITFQTSNVTTYGLCYCFEQLFLDNNQTPTISDSDCLRTINMWSLLLSQQQFCNENEEFVVGRGCTCQVGAHCESIGKDGLGVKSKDSFSMIVFLAIVGGIVALVSYQLLRRANIVIERMNKIIELFATKNKAQ